MYPYPYLSISISISISIYIYLYLYLYVYIHKEYYHADQMALSLIGSQNLDDLQAR